MKMEFIHYKLCSTNSFNRLKLIEYFSNCAGAKFNHAINTLDEQLNFEDGSYILFKEAQESGRVYAMLYFSCKKMTLLESFISFCSENNSKIRSQRNGQTLEASMGSVFSDMKNSKPFRFSLNKS